MGLVELYVEIIVPTCPQDDIPFVDYVYVCDDLGVFERARLFDMGVAIPVLSLEDLIVWILKENSGLKNPLDARVRPSLAVPTLLLLNANDMAVGLKKLI